MPKKAKPSTRSPKSAPASPPKRKRGRQPGAAGNFIPTNDQRDLVSLGAGLGIPEEDLATAVINPNTDRPISPVTLRKYFRMELTQGIVKVKMKGGANLLALTSTNAACAIFFAKCRLGFNERASFIPDPGRAMATAQGAFAGFQEEELQVAEGKGMTEIARRIAWTLTMGTQPQPEAAKPASKAGRRRPKKAVKKQPQTA